MNVHLHLKLQRFMKHDACYDYEGKVVQAAVLDRVSEMSSRIGIPKDMIHWNTKLNSLDYSRSSNNNERMNQYPI